MVYLGLLLSKCLIALLEEVRTWIAKGRFKENDPLEPLTRLGEGARVDHVTRRGKGQQPWMCLFWALFHGFVDIHELATQI